MLERLVCGCRSEDVAPAVKLFIRPVIAVLQFFWGDARRVIDNMACVVQVPVPGCNPVLRVHPREQFSSGIRRQNMKSCSSDSTFDSPVHGLTKDVAVISIQTKHKAPIDHDAEVIESSNNLGVATAEVLSLSGTLKTCARKCFKPNEQTSESCLGRF